MAIFPVRRQEAELFQRALLELRHDFNQTLVLAPQSRIPEHVFMLVHSMMHHLKHMGVREIEEVEITPRLSLEEHSIIVDLQPKGPMGEALIEGLHELEDEAVLLRLEELEDQGT